MMDYVRPVDAIAIVISVLPRVTLVLIVLRQHMRWRLSVALKTEEANGEGHAQKQYRNLPQPPPN
jgi:hypothetical protein